MSLIATFDTDRGPIRVELHRRQGPADRRQLRQPGPARLLRRPELPPRDHRFHGPGRLPAGHRHRRPGLQVRGRDQQRPAATSAACCRWPTPAPTPTAASSSSPTSPRRGWTASTPCSARSSRAWTWSTRQAGRRDQVGEDRGRRRCGAGRQGRSRRRVEQDPAADPRGLKHARKRVLGTSMLVIPARPAPGLNASAGCRASATPSPRRAGSSTRAAPGTPPVPSPFVVFEGGRHALVCQPFGGR